VLAPSQFWQGLGWKDLLGFQDFRLSPCIFIKPVPGRGLAKVIYQGIDDIKAKFPSTGYLTIASKDNHTLVLISVTLTLL
jgi:hypothetical protein